MGITQGVLWSKLRHPTSSATLPPAPRFQGAGVGKGSP